MTVRIRAFRSFYRDVYLDEHRHPISRLLHYAGSWLAICLVAASFITSRPALLWLVPLVGYGFAWVGHFVFERNRPATFRHPLFSLGGDWVMWWQITTRQLPIRAVPARRARKASNIR